MRSYTHVISKVFGTPLMLAPGKIGHIVNALQRRFAEGPSMAPSLPGVSDGDFGVSYPEYRVVNGIAIRTIEGTLVHKAMGAAPPSGFVAYPDIEADLARAASDPNVRAVLLDIDSPGGEASDSAFQLANAVRALAARKPVWAVVDEQATSGAYLLACGATRILAPRMSATGSIGVIAVHMDASAHEAQEGFKWTVIRAGARKAEGNPYEPPSPGYLADLQASIDRLYVRFVDLVAASRNISADAVRATEAAVFDNAEDALRLGLIDEIATPDQALAALAASLAAPVSVSGAAVPGTISAKPAAAAAPRKEKKMTNTNAAPPQDEEDPNKPAPAQSAPGASDGSTCEQCGKQLAPAASAEARAAANASERKVGADAERARILAIQAHGRAMPGHEALVAACVNDPTVAADAAAARLLGAEADKRKKSLDAALAEDPKVPAAVPAAETGVADANVLAAQASKLVAAETAAGRPLSYASAMARVLKGERA